MTSQKRREKAERVLSSIMGKEVLSINQSNYKLSLIQVMNYHNVFTDPKVLKKAILSYLKKNKLIDHIPSIESASDHDIRQIGILILHKERGDFLDSKEILFIENSLNSIKNAYKSPVVKIKVKQDTDKDKSLEFAKKLASTFDGEIDDILLKKSKGELNPQIFLDNNNVPEKVRKKITSFYKDQLQEFTELVNGNEDIKEGYSITKPHAKRILTFIQSIMDACGNVSKVKNTINRKPRAKKKKPASMLVAKIQYLSEFKELNLKSIDPKTIIGAKQLWIYNTKYKKLTRLISDSPDGLSVKGTTIIGFNESESESKRVRKPELVLSDVSKKSLAFHMKKMKTKPSPVNGRINKETILLTI